MKYTTPYVPPTLTVDAVIFQIQSNVLEVLLLNRQQEPFKGEWALPGGYNAKGETTTNALHRIVLQKTSVDTEQDLNYLEQLYTFDTVDRDPRGHAVSVTYMGCGRDIQIRETTPHIAFMPVDRLPALAYDHVSIIKYAHERLMTRLSYTDIISTFLPPRFTLSQLQTAYEVILGHELDKRNFRKKFLSLDMITETDETWRDGAHRPARLYKFKPGQQSSPAHRFD